MGYAENANGCLKNRKTGANARKISVLSVASAKNIAGFAIANIKYGKITGS